jgi:predicted ATPase
LDNCEHLLDQVAELVSALEARSRVTILARRGGLGLRGEHLIAAFPVAGRGGGVVRARADDAGMVVAAADPGWNGS